MRWPLACVLVVAATASARVVRIPQVASECHENATWGDVMTCVGRFGDARLARSLPHAKLVRVTRRSGDHPDAPGMYLFVEEHGRWGLGGMYEGEAELLGFDRTTLGTHGIYRFEIGLSEHTDVALDDVATAPAVIVLHDQVYCGGTGYHCSTIVAACDVLVAGKAVATFRGTVTWKNDALHVAGDRTHVGNNCQQREDVPVYFRD